MKYLLFILFFFFFVQTIKSQETKTYNDAWFLLLNNYSFSEDWSAGSEIHWRCTNFLSNRQQLLLRPFINYHLDETIVFTAGYTYIRSYPYTENAASKSIPEHNIWEQVTLNHHYKKLDFSHRFRIEQRFQGQLALTNNKYVIDEYEFANRFRYRLTFRHTLTKKWFLHIFDELWVKMNGDFQQPEYDRNWIYLGVGYRTFNDHGNIQLAYLHQNINKGSFFERHPTLQLTVQYNFDFRKGNENTQD